MEPTPAEAQNISNIRELLTWAGVSIELSKAFEGITGLSLTDHYRLLAIVDEDDYKDLLKVVKVKTTSGSERPPTMKEFSQLRVVWQAARSMWNFAEHYAGAQFHSST